MIRTVCLPQGFVAWQHAGLTLCFVLCILLLCAAAHAGEPAADAARVQPLDLMKLKGEKEVDLQKLEEGVYLWELSKTAGQGLSIDIADLGFDPRAYDEFRFDLLPEGSLTRVMMKVKAFPEPMKLRSWYSKMRTEVGEWSDIRFDMHVDDDGFWFKTKEPYTPSLELSINKRFQGLPGEPDWRKATIRNPRFVKNLIGLSFDHTAVVQEENSDEVAYVYTLQVENRTDRAQEVTLDADSEKTLKYFAVEAPATVALAAGETKAVPVRLSIPRNLAMTLPALYAERIVPRVEVPGVPDSDVVTLMGYRRWPMWAVVPVFHRIWWTPASFQAHIKARKDYIPHYDRWEKTVLDGARSALAKEWPLPPEDLMPPGYIMSYRCPDCKGWLKPAGHATFRKHRCDKCDKFYEGIDHLDQAHTWRYLGNTFGAIRTLSLAWLLTGEDAYAEKAVAMFTQYADAYPTFPMSRYSSTAGGARLNTTTLYSCFIAMGLPEAFNYLHEAPAMTPEAYRKIRAFLLDEAGRVVRHCVYDSNMTAEHIRFYGSTALATGYWPYAGEAINGEFGWHEMVDHAFSEDGIGHEAGAYHKSIFHAMLGFAEFAAEHQVNLLTARFKRVFDGTLTVGAAGGESFALAYEVYRDPQYLRTLKGAGVFHGVLGLPAAAAIPVRSQVLGGVGYVFLRKGTMADNRQIRINYKNSFDRTEKDRLQTKFIHNGRRIDAEVNRMMYSDPNSKWMYQTAAHSTIVIDGATQTDVAGRLVATDFAPDAPVAVLATRPDAPFYQGVQQVRGVALIGRWHVVFDRVAADREVTIDRYQYGVEPLAIDAETAPLSDLAALPAAGKFHDAVGAAVGREVDLRYGQANRKEKAKDGPMLLRVVADRDMTACKATTIGGWFGGAMETSFVRVTGRDATFLAAATDDVEATPPALAIEESTDARMVLAVRDETVDARIVVDLAAGTVAVEGTLAPPVGDAPADPEAVTEE